VVNTFRKVMCTIVRANKLLQPPIPESRNVGTKCSRIRNPGIGPNLGIAPNLGIPRIHRIPGIGPNLGIPGNAHFPGIGQKREKREIGRNREIDEFLENREFLGNTQIEGYPGIRPGKGEFLPREGGNRPRKGNSPVSRGNWGGTPPESRFVRGNTLFFAVFSRNRPISQNIASEEPETSISDPVFVRGNSTLPGTRNSPVSGVPQNTPQTASNPGF